MVAYQANSARLALAPRAVLVAAVVVAVLVRLVRVDGVRVKVRVHLEAFL